MLQNKTVYILVTKKQRARGVKNWGTKPEFKSRPDKPASSSEDQSSTSFQKHLQ